VDAAAPLDPADRALRRHGVGIEDRVVVENSRCTSAGSGSASGFNETKSGRLSSMFCSRFIQ